MRQSKTRKHERTRVRKVNKLAKTERSKNKRADNAVIREEMGDKLQIVRNVIYTWSQRRELIL